VDDSHQRGDQVLGDGRLDQRGPEQGGNRQQNADRAGLCHRLLQDLPVGFDGKALIYENSEEGGVEHADGGCLRGCKNAGINTENDDNRGKDW